MAMGSKTLYFHPHGQSLNTSLWNHLFASHLILYSGVIPLCPSHPFLAFLQLFHYPLKCQLHGKLHWTFLHLLCKPDFPENATSPTVLWSCFYSSVNDCLPSSHTDTSSPHLPGCFPFTVLHWLQGSFTHSWNVTGTWLTRMLSLALSPPNFKSCYHYYSLLHEYLFICKTTPKFSMPTH